MVTGMLGPGQDSRLNPASSLSSVPVSVEQNLETFQIFEGAEEIWTSRMQVRLNRLEGR
jgi:hypothetical protein